MAEVETGEGARAAGAGGAAAAGAEAGAGEAAGSAPPPARKRRPRSKLASAGKAVAKAEALSAAGAEAMAELAKLQRSMGQLVQGLSAMLDTQVAHEELLRAILKAATAPTDPERELSGLLEQIALRLDEVRGETRAVRAGMDRLPGAIGAAMGEQLASALAAVR